MVKKLSERSNASLRSELGGLQNQLLKIRSQVSPDPRIVAMHEAQLKVIDEELRKRAVWKGRTR